MSSYEKLDQIARLVRRFVLIATSNAGSGHPTSGLSAADLMVGLMFGGFFKYDAEQPNHPDNDRLIFSKGHASPLLYEPAETFPIGGCKVLRHSDNDAATVVAAGITVHEALKAYDTLKGEGIKIRVIDCYSIKPIDEKVLGKAAEDTKTIITVEDHYAEGGLGEAVMSALAPIFFVPVYLLAVCKKPKSGKPEELLDYEGISHTAIEKKVRKIAG